MTTKTQQDKQVIAAAFSRLLDPAMFDSGFARGPGSLSYHRRVNEADQRVTMDVRRHPYYHPSAWLHLIPGFRVTVKRVETELARIAGGEHRTTPTVSGTYELVAPKPVPVVYIESPDDIDAGITRLRDLLIAHIVPFLDTLTGPADFVMHYVKGESDRPAGWRSVHAFVGDHVYARVAVAAILTGRSDVAEEVASRELAGPDAKRRYAGLLDHILTEPH